MVTVWPGRYYLFTFMGRKFDHEKGRVERDGAFIAALLDTSSLRKGDYFYEHRADDEKDTE